MNKHKLHEEVEDILQHAGIKGMKWGVRRKSSKVYGRRKFYNDKVTIDEKVRKKKLTKKQGNAEIDKNRHKMNMAISKSYQKSYAKNTAKGMNHYKARNKAQFKKDLTKALTRRLAVVAVTGATTLGPSLVGAARGKVMTPDNIRAGKNLVKAAMRSNVRYVDGRKMTNVINVASKRIGG